MEKKKNINSAQRSLEQKHSRENGVINNSMHNYYHCKCRRCGTNKTKQNKIPKRHFGELILRVSIQFDRRKGGEDNFHRIFSF